MAITAEVIGAQRIAGDENYVAVPISPPEVARDLGFVFDERVRPTSPAMTHIGADGRPGFPPQRDCSASESCKRQLKVHPALVVSDAPGVNGLRK
jgi:hypothetical protein